MCLCLHSMTQGHVTLYRCLESCSWHQKGGSKTRQALSLDSYCIYIRWLAWSDKKSMRCLDSTIYTFSHGLFAFNIFSSYSSYNDLISGAAFCVRLICLFGLVTEAPYVQPFLCRTPIVSRDTFADVILRILLLYSPTRFAPVWCVDATPLFV